MFVANDGKMAKSRTFLIILALLASLVSCRSHREMVYISDAERDSAQQMLNTYSNSIHTGDLLYIYVYSQQPESTIPFNQETHKILMEETRLNTVSGTGHAQIMRERTATKSGRQVEGYLVDQDGFIRFPVLGKISVEGITYDSLQNCLQKMLVEGQYIMDAVVTVSPMNFRVTVVGEVRRPSELHITGERLTIFEALAMCGDITQYGLRDNVVVMREKNGTITPIEIDLTKKTMFDSEVYYLQQNDIVYVEPTALRKWQAERHRIRARHYASIPLSILQLVHISYVRYVLDRRGLFH